jgi:hypothetical protein
MKLSIPFITSFILWLTTSVCFAQSFEKDMDTTLYGRNKAVGKYAELRGIKCITKCMARASLY